ncbi:MAG: hypothetical protein AMS25_05250 [Gemmatimonas sp. SM23_52]|nr:MAG: hypothetical protein AMS25_05250 [Gemmatimonas sp. SM23_52]
MKHAHAFLGGALLALLAAVPAWGQELAQERAVDVSGVWEITSETPRGTMTRKVTFEQDGSSLTGTMETRMGSVPIQNGSVEGNKISFTVVFSRGERSFEMTYSGTVEGDTAKGTYQTPRGEVEWTAKRVAEQ